MKPFSSNSSDRLDPNLKNRADRDFQLRTNLDEERKEQTPYSSDNQPSSKLMQKDNQDIRKLGFFKEQERRFSQPENEEEWHERQSPINFILIVGVFVTLCLIGWFGYRWANQAQRGEPPIITSDPTPVKIRPENPGGMVIPHQDKLIYGRLSPEQQQPVEHLLPTPEPLIAPPVSKPKIFVDANGQQYYAYPIPKASNAYSQNQGQQNQPDHAYEIPPSTEPAEPEEYYYEHQPGQYSPQEATSPDIQPQMREQQLVAARQPAPPPLQPQQQPSQAALSTENKVSGNNSNNTSQERYASSLTQQPLPTQFPETKTSTLPVPNAPLPPLSQPQRMDTSPPQSKNGYAANIAPKNSDKVGLDQLIENELNPENSQKTTNSSENLDNPAKKGSKGTSYKLQVNSLESKSAAEKELKRIRNIEPALFKDKKMFIEKITSDGGKKTSYRIIIGKFTTLNEAYKISNKLKIHKVNGIIAPNPN